MYVHGVVELPIEPTREVRVAVYRLFLQNTLRGVWCPCFNPVQTVFFFLRSEHTDAEILQLTLLPYPGGPSLYPKDLKWTWPFFSFFLLHRFHTTSLSQLPHKCGWKRIATIPGYWPAFWDSQLDDSFVGTIALPHLSSDVVHILPYVERLCRTIVWILWSNQVDVHSRNCVFSNRHYTVFAYTKMRVWHVFSQYPSQGGSHSH